MKGVDTCSNKKTARGIKRFFVDNSGNNSHGGTAKNRKIGSIDIMVSSTAKTGMPKNVKMRLVLRVPNQP